MRPYCLLQLFQVVALVLQLCAATTGASSVYADDRAGATRINYLMIKGYCSSASDCQNPAGKEVDHIVPLWAGGADHPSNMQLISREAHLAKSQAEQVLRNQMVAAIRAGNAPVLQSPANGMWAKGMWSGTLLRPLDDGRLLVRLDLTRQLADGGDARAPLIIAVPLAGLSRAGDGVRSDLHRSMRAFVGQPLLIAPQTATSLKLTPMGLAKSGFGGQDNFPAALIAPRNSGVDARNLNVQLVAAGLVAVDDSAVDDLPKKLRKDLKLAQSQARKAGTLIWAAEAAAKAAAKAARETAAREAREARAYRYSGGGDDDAGDDGEGAHGSRTVNVRGYSRGDGTYVAPHTRSAPSSSYGGGSGFSGFGGGRRR